MSKNIIGDSGYVKKQTLGQQGYITNKGSRIHHLDIELTERCNNACVHCYINLPENDRNVKKQELATDQWKEIIRQAMDLGVLSIRFTGGEPLLREDFSDLYLFTRKLGIQVVLFTNACLINQDLADLFQKYPPLKKIEISVYGMKRDSYEAVTCVSGTYASFMNGINLLQERNIPFITKTVLLPQNRHDLDQFISWSNTVPGMIRKPAFLAYLDLRARRDNPSKNRFIRRLRLTPEESLKVLAENGENQPDNLARFASKFMGPPGDRLFPCGAGEKGCVDAYGKLQMCLLLRHPDTVVDLKKRSLLQGMTEDFPRLREMRAQNQDYLLRCARCFLKGLCEQCPAKSWTEYGTLDTPVEYLCQVAHSQARYYGLLSENEYGWEVVDWQDRIQKLSKVSIS